MGWRSSRYEFRMVFLFALLHAGVLAVLFVPFSPHLFLWTASTYVIRMFGVTAGYHRYFSHRSYKLGRACAVLMAALAQTSGRRACFGGLPSTASITATPTRAGHPFARAAWLLVGACGMGPVQRT